MARKTPDTSEWGTKTAKERHGDGSGSGGLQPADKGDYLPESPCEQHGPGYANDVSLSGWLRGTDATKKPGFAKPWNKR